MVAMKRRLDEAAEEMREAIAYLTDLDEHDFDIVLARLVA